MAIEKAYAAANIPNDLPGNLVSDRFTTIGGILSAAINIVFYVAVGICLIYLIIGGIKYATSGGDPKAAAAAKDTVTHALIGAVIVIAFRSILALIFSLMGITANNFIPGF